jgi:hypothetical protein
MLIIATLIVLALWMAFIWYVDPDGLVRVPVRARKSTRTRRR